MKKKELSKKKISLKKSLKIIQKKNELENLKIKLYLLKLKSNEKNLLKNLAGLNEIITKSVFFKTRLNEKKELFSISLKNQFKSEETQKKMIKLLNERINVLLYRLDKVVKSENTDQTNLKVFLNLRKNQDIINKINSFDQFLF